MPAAPAEQPRKPRPLWLTSAITMAALAAALIAIELIDALTPNHDLDANGIEPREVGGLDGILWSPFLHGDWSHLFGNLGPGVVLGFLLLMAKRFLAVTGVVWLTSGVGVWLTAPSYTVTIGASGIIFGWLTYLLIRGIFNRNLKQILIGVVLFLVYGSVLWGVLPTDESISWQGHLFGAIGGVAAAWYLASRDRRRRRAPSQPLPSSGVGF
ncbi:MAG: rhomboid family intramembrane serine protease [Gordonia amarae]